MPPATDVSPAESLFLAEEAALAASPLRRPGATYRLQLHHGFRLDDATAIVPYLDDLGITDVYMSPYLEARPGSTHGYDVFDHGRINPEVGDDAAHGRLVAALEARGMGRLLDVVPNHMGIGGPNRFWLDVLELGPHAPSAAFFDVDWHPVKEELEGRILLPILEDQYGKVLEDGKLVLKRDGGTLSLHYHETKLPVTPRSYGTVLGRGVAELAARHDPEDPHVLEYLSIAASAESLPPRASASFEDIDRRMREKSVIPRRLALLCEESPALRDLIDRAIAEFQGNSSNPSSFEPLHRLLEEQVYRLAYWRVAAQEINYRRFFDINDLAGLRTEDPRVFDAVHKLIFAWVAQGNVVGLRIDHPDGLADPLGYFRRLQESAFLIRCRARFDAEGHEPDQWADTAIALRKRHREAVANDPRSPLTRALPVVAEKILSRGEDLPQDWPIDGTVGYEYLNALNGLFVEPASSDAIEVAYAEFTGDREPFVEVLYRAKSLIARVSLASEVNTLARQLNRVSERDLRSRDFTLNDLRLAVREAIACFPVYRTYLLPGEPASARDRGYIEQAVARARKRAPALDPTIFDFLREVLLLEAPAADSATARGLREQFIRRFQQTTGPIQAKGLEDTAFYRQYPLASICEVGADPSRFGNSPAVFHALNGQRLSHWPGALSTTATHDTKRGEDARIRIDVLSEISDEWKLHLARWSRIHARKKAEVRDAPAPDAREEYLLYQALVGAWPFGGPDDATPEGLVPRIQAYLVKAVREAKIHTSWSDPDSSYSDALSAFVAEVLEGPDAATFLRDFLPFQRRISRVAVVHSLAQTLLKLGSPGVPDVYQGCDLWDFSLVDPDNRRPVDYGGRASLLEGIRDRLRSGTPRAELARDLFAAPEDGAIKLYVTATALRHRRDHHTLYAQGAYRAFDAEGEHKAKVVSFGRQREGHSVVVMVPRLVAGLMGEDGGRPPLGQEVWADTRVVLPEGPVTRRWRDLLTDRTFEVRDVEGRSSLLLAELFRDVPLAMLVPEADSAA